VERVDSRNLGQGGRELDRQLYAAARADLPVRGVGEDAARQAAREVGHPPVAQQRDTCIDPDVGEQVRGPVKESAQRLDVKHHLRLQESRAGGELAFKEPHLTVEILGERVDHGADGQVVRPPPPMRLADERGRGEVFDPWYVLDAVAIQTQDAFGSQRGGAHDLRSQRQPVAIAARDVDHGRHALFARERDRRERRHPRLPGVIVGETDHIDGYARGGRYLPDRPRRSGSARLSLAPEAPVGACTGTTRPRHDAMTALRLATT
jgi:hypothetical protein